MDIVIALTIWAWIGWVVTTGLLAFLYYVTYILGTIVHTRLKRLYHWRVLSYWLGRLEREGKRTFERPD